MTTKKSLIIKAVREALFDLKAQGIIRTHTPEDVKAQMEAHEEKEAR